MKCESPTWPKPFASALPLPALAKILALFVLALTTPTHIKADFNLTLTLKPSGGFAELSWTSQSLTPSPPFLHYDFSIEQSTNLESWSEATTPFSGGSPQQEVVPWMKTYPLNNHTTFFRLKAGLHRPGGNLAGLNLQGSDLSASNLQNANLSNANLSHASLSGTDLRGANFAGTQLQGATFENANIDGVSLDLTPLGGVDFAGSIGTPKLRNLAGSPETLAASVLPLLPLRTTQNDFENPQSFWGRAGVSRSNIVIALQPTTTTAQLNAFLQRENASIVGSLPLNPTNGIALLTLKISRPNPGAEALYQHCLSLASDPIIISAAPDAMLGFNVVTDDRSAATGSGGTWNWSWDDGYLPGGGNWGLEKAHVPQMWNIREALIKRGVSNVETAILDGGFPLHSDLPLFLINPGTPGDAPDHGLHVAGTIGAGWNNGLGIDGVNPFSLLYGYTYDSSLIRDIPGTPLDNVLKNYLRSGTAFIFFENTYRMMSAVPQARIANFSLGYNWIQDREPDALTQTVAHGLALAHGKSFQLLAGQYPQTLFIGAAGNDFLNIPARDSSPLTAAGLIYNTPNILVVESTAPDGSRSSFSNSGGNLSAPGGFILSLTTNNSYDVKSGTSMASPFASGVAGYLLAADPSLTIAELRQLLISPTFALDAYQALLKIDGLPGRNKEIARMLLDLDDGTPDGITRVKVPNISPLGDRNFLPIQGTDRLDDEDVDGDGGLGDGTIDMSDFRVFRDHLQLAEQTTPPSGALNGDMNQSKMDSNRNGFFEGVHEGKKHPWMDFNGDGRLNRNETSLIATYSPNFPVTDAALFTFADLWNDPDYSASEAIKLLDSADFIVSAKSVFLKYPDLPDLDVWLLDGTNLAKIGKPRRFSRTNDTHIFTVPLGMTYLFGSDPFPRIAGSYAALRAIAPFSLTPTHRGGDFAVDLTYTEMTARFSTDEPSHSNIQSKPFVRSISAEIAELTQKDTTGHPPRSFANDQATLYCYARSDTLSGADPEKQTVYKSSVDWVRSFSKIPGKKDPQFHVKPIRLKLGDMDSKTNELRASTEITLERRTGPASNAVWKTIFHSHIEIIGARETDTTTHTFRIETHQGFPSQLTPTFTPDPAGKIVGMEIILPDFLGTISLADIEDQASFELRYRLRAEALGPLNASNPCDGDCIAEAYVGDPLNYGSGTTMRYDNFGELFELIDVDQSSDQLTRVTHTSSPQFYFTLYRTNLISLTESPVAIHLGTSSVDTFIYTTAAAANLTLADFRLVPRPLDQPADTDGDGIDDVYELTHPSILNPLNPSDAAADSDGDTLSNLAEYQKGTDPLIKDQPPTSPSQLYPALAQPSDLAAFARSADFNNDQHPDLVSLGGDTGNLLTQLANPDGTFQLPVETIIDWPASFAMDLQTIRMGNDSLPDIAITALVTNRVFVYRGLGDGHFSLVHSLPTGSNPRRIHVADLNHDGIDDFLVLNDRSGSISRFLGSITGNYTQLSDISLASWGQLTDVTTGDFNKDGVLDIAASAGLNTVLVLMLKPDGSFETPQILTVDSFPDRIANADLDGDGFLDLFTTSPFQGTLSVLYGSVSAQFAAEVRTSLPPAPLGILPISLNQDNLIDLLISHRDGITSIILGKTTRSPFTPNLIPAQLPELPLADDFNSDGKPDLLANSFTYQCILKGNGDGSFDSATLTTEKTAQWSFMHLENHPALNASRWIGVNTLSNTLEIVELTSPNSHRIIQRIPTSPNSAWMSLEDINGDSYPDAVVASYQTSFGNQTNGTNQIRIFSGSNPGSYTPSTIIPLPHGPTQIVIADFNGDSRNDCVVFHSEPLMLSLYLQQSNGAWIRQPDFPLSSYPTTLTPFHLDADNSSELILSGLGFETQILRYNSGTWSVIAILPGSDSTTSLLTTDYDQDGDQDLLISSYDFLQAKIEVRLNDSGTLSAPQSLLNLEGPGLIHTQDLNGDGLKDLISDDGSSIVSIYLAKTSGGYQPPQVHLLNFPTNAGMQKDYLFIHDLTQDGKPELIRASGSQFQTLIHR